jgi:hypothetical protein
MGKTDYFNESFSSLARPTRAARAEREGETARPVEKNAPRTAITVNVMDFTNHVIGTTQALWSVSAIEISDS